MLLLPVAQRAKDDPELSVLGWLGEYRQVWATAVVGTSTMAKTMAWLVELVGAGVG